MAGTMVLSIQFGLSQRYPILPALVVLTGLALLALLIHKKFTIPRLVLNILGWLLALLFGWYMFSYSEYGGEELKIARGDTVAAQIAELELKTDDGGIWAPMTALAESKATLLVFYRGFW
jgi:uncharacterized membrane protein YccC